MKWFSGSIPEAISFIRSQKNTLVSFVEGTCEKSKMMASALNEKSVSDELEKNKFVCIKLEANSIGHKQLAETYKSVPVPSLFFISHNGVPLNIVEGDLYDTSSELVTAILEAAEYSERLNSEPETNTVAKDKVLQERRRQVEELINMKRRDVAHKKSKPQAKEEEKSQDVENNEYKTLKENELKKLVEEREKEKKAEALARQKILDQIAQDKAERAERMKMTEVKPSTSSLPTSLPSSSAVNNTHDISTVARIQFRLPTGESRSDVFPNGTTLKEIRNYIDRNLELTSRNYQLTTTFPRREFTLADNASSLEELSLTPTAVILILTKPSGSVYQVPRDWFTLLTKMAQEFLRPFYSLRDYLKARLFPSSAGTPTAQPSQSTPAPPQPRQAPPSRTYVRKSGNIHSLKDLRDGNDENNTWNGNSTQQM